MINYLYWGAVISLAMAVLVLFGRADKWKAGVISSAVIFLIGLVAFFFHFEQIFVKRFGGSMSISVPDGQMHLGATWKDDNLWIENYDPASNTCHFSEYSKGGLLQGKVTIKNCNPLLSAADTSIPDATPPIPDKEPL